MSIQFKEIAFSCYAVTDFARARKFYEGILGLKPSIIFGEGGPMQWGEYDIAGGTLSIGSAPGWKPSPDGCTVALEVVDFDAAVKHLQEKGVTFRMGPIETPGCHMASVLDPDGNSIMIHQRKAG